MPSAITHYLCGQRVLEKLKERELVKVIDENAFAWGCQGPDFLFCHRFLPWMRGESIARYGSLIHRTDPNKVLSSMISYIKEKKELRSSSYFLGFVCHYSLDSVAHPYVDFLGDKMEKENVKIEKGSGHVIVESTLDTVFLRYEKEIIPSEVKLQSYFPKDNEVQKIIADMYKYLIFNLFGEDASYENIFQSTKDSISIFSALNDKTGLKRNILEKVGKFAKFDVAKHFRPIIEDDDIDYANVSKETWKDYEGSERQEDFFELASMGCDKALNIIYGFETDPLENLTLNEPFCREEQAEEIVSVEESAEKIPEEGADKDLDKKTG